MRPYLVTVALDTNRQHLVQGMCHFGSERLGGGLLSSVLYTWNQGNGHELRFELLMAKHISCHFYYLHK